ncbi:MAG: arylsulfatase [Arenicella sp.]|nr:arylsulfatase [Arenicella sp.]
MTMIKLAVLMLMSFAMFGTASAQINAPVSEPSRPNIVLILADDLGYSDIGPFGSEINTPNLSALAENGIRFSNYHTAASCAPSRSMLLTGVDSHRAGVPNIPEAIPPEQITQTNYQGVLSKNVVTVATLLEDQGYHTVMAGKWHLGMEPDQLPSSRGFKRTITMADTGADNWEQRPYLPIYKKANWFADGKETTLPDDFYSSELLVDKTIEFIEEKQDKQPFFAYIPFQAVHIPVQSPKHFTDKYLDTYSDGWDALRKQRQSKAVALGHVPADSQMVKMQSTADWQSLDEEEKRYQSKRMAVYAGMVEAMDHHIGRLVEQLKQSGQYENTVFIFTSDNGAEYNGWNNQRKLTNRLLQWYMGYNLDLDNLGLKGSFNAIGPSFASAAASPLSFYKFYSGEGGLRVPLIIAGDPIAANNAHSRAFTFVTDITPTILELSNITRPETRYGGRTIEPIIGKSLIPLLNGDAERVYGENDAVAYEIGGNAALFQSDYKIMKNRGPMGGDQWQLFNIALDPGETVNLAEDMPERFESMLGLYDDYVQKNGVLPVSAEYVQIVQVFINGFRDVQGMRLLVLVLSGLVVMLVVLTAYSVRVKNRT